MSLPLDWKRDPFIANARNEMAACYRKVRADSTAVARLLRRREIAATRMLREDLERKVYHGSTGSGGLDALFGDDI